MSFHLGRTVVDGLVNVIKNIPIAALSAQGVPSSTTVLYGDGIWKQPILVAPVSPAYDGSAKSAATGELPSGTPFSWVATGTSGAYGIVLLDCISGYMDLGLTAPVTWGGIPMTRLGGVYKNNNSTFGFQLVFILDGIPGGSQNIVVTPTQSGKLFAGYGTSYSYTNVASVGSLITAHGSGAPSFSVTAAHANDIVWGATDTNAAVLTGFSLPNTRQSNSGVPYFAAGDTTGSTSYTISGSATGAGWSGVALDLISAVGISTDTVPEGSTNLYYTNARVDAEVPAATHAATSKTTPVDADELPIADSAASFGLKKLTWANLKATIKTYYDPVASTLTNKDLSSGTNTFPTLNQSTTGNAATATKLATARNINGVSFDGSAAVITDSGIGPSDFGWGGWSHDIAACFNTPVALPVAGLVYLVALPIHGIQTITNLIINVGTAGSGLTSGQNFAGLYQNGAFLAATADQSTNWASTGAKVMALSTPQLVNSANGVVYAAFFANGTTRPALYEAAIGSAAWQAIAASGVFKRWTYDSTNTGRTTSFPTTLGTLGTSQAVPYWIGWS